MATKDKDERFISKRPVNARSTASNHNAARVPFGTLTSNHALHCKHIYLLPQQPGLLSVTDGIVEKNYAFHTLPFRGFKGVNMYGMTVYMLPCMRVVGSKWCVSPRI